MSRVKLSHSNYANSDEHYTHDVVLPLTSAPGFYNQDDVQTRRSVCSNHHSFPDGSDGCSPSSNQTEE